MKGRFTRILGAFLFVVFLAGIMPKEYIHDAFFDHDDDIHPLYKKGEMVITKQHNHCSFLSFEFAPFVSTPTIVFVFRDYPVYHAHCPVAYEFLFTRLIQASHLRGPPAYTSSC